VNFRARPSPEELAAIIAAVEVAWPRPVVVTPPPRRDAWRWSGRWWGPREIAATRQRPWM